MEITQEQLDLIKGIITDDYEINREFWRHESGDAWDMEQLVEGVKYHTKIKELCKSLDIMTPLDDINTVIENVQRCIKEKN